MLKLKVVSILTKTPKISIINNSQKPLHSNVQGFYYIIGIMPIII